MSRFSLIGVKTFGFWLAEEGVFGGFFGENEPYFRQNREKPEKTCGNRRNAVDKERGKAEGELRTVLRTRMNTDDFAVRMTRFSPGSKRDQCGRADKFTSLKARRSNTHGKGNDKDSARPPHGRKARDHQQAGCCRP
jgi:hypothetical protein